MLNTPVFMMLSSPLRRGLSYMKDSSKLSFISRLISKPDLAKLKGEDAHFTSKLDLGCFDGVGGWRDIGVRSI